MGADIEILDPPESVETERPFVLERSGGTRIMLSASELWQRWADQDCRPNERVVDIRYGRQFPAICLQVLGQLDGSIKNWDLFTS